MNVSLEQSKFTQKSTFDRTQISASIVIKEYNEYFELDSISKRLSSLYCYKKGLGNAQVTLLMLLLIVLFIYALLLGNK